MPQQYCFWNFWSLYKNYDIVP